MSEFRKSASGRGNAPTVIIVNNLDYPMRYAAWFGKRQAQTAIRLARAAGFHVLDVDSDRLEELASHLKEGSVQGGDLSLAIVDAEITPDLNALVIARQAVAAVTEPAATTGDAAAIDASPDSSAELDQLSGHTSSDAWGELQPGAHVLAASLDRFGAAEAWFDAIIVRIEGSEFVLRWRDFPRSGLLTLTRRHIAILPPAA